MHLAEQTLMGSLPSRTLAWPLWDLEVLCLLAWKGFSVALLPVSMPSLVLTVLQPLVTVTQSWVTVGVMCELTDWGWQRSKPIPLV